MSFTVPPPGTAAANYQKALELYSASEVVAATGQAVDNLNDSYMPRYIQIKNLLMVGTLVEDEGHSFNYLTLAGEVFHNMAEDVTGGRAAEQVMGAINQEIRETIQRREGADGPVALGEKAFEVFDTSVLGMVPEMDVADTRVREHIKHVLATRDAAIKEAASLREQANRAIKRNDEVARELARVRVQPYQQRAINRRGVREYSSLLLNILVVCIVVLVIVGRMMGVF